MILIYSNRGFILGLFVLRLGLFNLSISAYKIYQPLNLLRFLCFLCIFYFSKIQTLIKCKYGNSVCVLYT